MLAKVALKNFRGATDTTPALDPGRRRILPRHILCLLLVARLGFADLAALPAQPGPGGSVKPQVLSLGPNSLVEVRLVNGSKLRGWIGTISENNFELRLGKVKLEQRTIEFDHVRSVKPVDSLKPSHTARNILIGVGIAVAAIGLGIVIAAKKGGYL